VNVSGSPDPSSTARRQRNGPSFTVDTTSEFPYFPWPTICAATTGFCMPLRAIILCSLLVAAAGCRFLAGTTATSTVASSARANAKPARRTIQLELAFVRHDSHDTLLHDELWRFVDEQFLDAETRDRLAANGLRVGIVGDHLPPHLAARLTAEPTVPTGEAELATDSPVSRRKLQLLPGRRGEIVTASGMHEFVLLERLDDGVHGTTFRDASSLLTIEATPAANGSVRITLVPEIKHGPIEKSWVGEDGMFRLEAGQRRHRLEHLSFAATLPRDGLLVLGCTREDSASVGDCLLRDRERGGGAPMRLVTIRPMADTVDPLFTPMDAEPGGSDDAPLTIR
jgi:hypothetical protein